MSLLCIQYENYEYESNYKWNIRIVIKINYAIHSESN